MNYREAIAYEITKTYQKKTFFFNKETEMLLICLWCTKRMLKISNIQNYFLIKNFFVSKFCLYFFFFKKIMFYFQLIFLIYLFFKVESGGRAIAEVNGSLVSGVQLKVKFRIKLI